MGKINFVADDYGLTKGLSETLYALLLKFDSLRNISAVPNGYYFNESIKRVKKKKIKGLKILCHLNVVECRPLSEARQVHLLIDKQGYLNNSFAKIMRIIFFAPRKKKRRYFLQIYREIFAQVKHFKQVVEPKELEINSHSHTHLVPPILKMVARISGKLPSSSIRVPREIFYVDFLNRDSLRNFFSSNLFKFYLTKIMVELGKTYLEESIQKKVFLRKSYFIGVYYTKNMTLEVVSRCIKKIVQRDRAYESIEILLHPGRLSDEDVESHVLNSGTKKYYLSKRHRDEEEILENSMFVLGM